LIEHRIEARPENLVGDLVRWEYNPITSSASSIWRSSVSS